MTRQLNPLTTIPEASRADQTIHPERHSDGGPNPRKGTEQTAPNTNPAPHTGRV